MSDLLDVVVVGVGAAGIAALDQLRSAEVSSLGLEARATIGGRAQTVRRRALPLDLGCGWLHSADRNILAHLFAERGTPLDRTPPSWGRQSQGPGADPLSRRSFAEAFAAFDARLEAAAEAGREGRASDHLEPGGAWNPRLDAVSTFYNGAELEEVSVLDYGAYEDSGVNWRAPNGYGAALAEIGLGLPVRLGCQVRRLDRSGPRLRLETAQGVVLARTVILAVPPTALLSGELDIAPPLPGKLAAAAGLPLGLADKVFLRLKSPERYPSEEHLLGAADRVATGSYLFRPFGRGYVEGFFGGRLAEELEGAGEGAMAAFAADELAATLGEAVRADLEPLEDTHWRAAPFIRGSYSHARPGCAAARADLAVSVEGRIFFAGEATHPRFFSTAHGAFESGIRAAKEALGALAGP